MSDELTILHLYPEELGINGDRGNVTALATRARWRGIPVRVIDHAIGEALPADVDLVHIGSGPLSAQRAVHEDLLTIAPQLIRWAEAGIPYLAISGGWQLLGTRLTLPGGEELRGAGVFSSSTRLVGNRTVGEALVETEWGIVAGFENHASVVELGAGEQPFGTVVKGGGNAPADGPDPAAGNRSEGVRRGASIGTHLHGAVLPLNPALADALLGAALSRERAKVLLPETDETRLADGYAANAREAIAGRLGARLR